MILAAATSLMIAGAAAPPTADVAGLYLTDQMEMAGALELGRDGRFHYQLDYGAVSESGEGDWTADCEAVRLVSNPMPRPPGFTLLSDDPAPAGELYVAVEDTSLSWKPLRVRLLVERVARPVYRDAGDDGRVALPAGRRATSVALMVPVYELSGEPVDLSVDRGHRLLFRFDANDLGKASFRREALAIDGSSLVMRRHGTNIIFRRAEQ